jgi:polyribonucleotide nucleotidyltransferase
MSYPKYTKTYKKEIKVADKTITVEIGKFSEQVAGAALVTCGETVVHTTVALGRKVDIGYFPLHVEFSEKLYAAGIIKGSRFVKREGRASDDAVLKARLIDRTIRPLFPEGVTNEVQIINTVFSFDGENDPDMLAMIGTTVALAVSPIPFLGPIAGVRVGYNKEDKKLIFNPTNTERETSDLDFIVSGSDEAVVMVEAGANEISEDVILEAMQEAQKILGKVCKNIAGIAKEIGKEKLELVEKMPEEEAVCLEKIIDEIKKKYGDTVKELVNKQAHLEPSNLDEVVEQTTQYINEQCISGKLIGEVAQGDTPREISSKEIAEIFHDLMKKEARRMILEDSIRPDGRKTDQIRQIWCEVDVFPRNHGSAMFKRGATQACTVTTLGNPSLGQLIEDLDGENTRHYIHHYNMPPFASGEAGRLGWPKRREVGHGALAERALLPMIPDQEDFPYTIRVVSEIMSSNGSTSQASVCGSTMSLMAAGVPIKSPVAGIAMGLMSDGKKYVVLSDIQGLEDHVGDMDFKVAGTKDGITALQMDIKLTGIPFDVLKHALGQARNGRIHILGEMLKCIKEPRPEISKYAPKVSQITIPADRIGELIGPGGKNIKNLIEVSGAEINVDEDEEKEVGLVNISSPDQEKIDKAREMIENMMRVVEVGEEFDGTVTRVESYGAFAEYLPGREGLVHVSQMSTQYVADAASMAKVGDKVKVRIAEIKDDGKIGLSMLTKKEAEQQRAASAGRRPSRPMGSNGRSGGGRFDRRSGGSDRRGGDRGGRSDRRSFDRSDRSDRNKSDQRRPSSRPTRERKSATTQDSKGQFKSYSIEEKS